MWWQFGRQKARRGCLSAYLLLCFSSWGRDHGESCQLGSRRRSAPLLTRMKDMELGFDGIEKWELFISALLPTVGKRLASLRFKSWIDFV
jgi:hypothetical protein